MTEFKMIRLYSECLRYKTYSDRLAYLQEIARIGEIKFGGQRYRNQDFYHSYEWRKFRNKIITRDFGCDLALEDHEILGNIFIHHINILSVEEFMEDSESLMDPENCICVSRATHDLIHYGGEPAKQITERKPGDTRLW